MKEIVFVIDNFNGGGAERVILTLADFLHKNNYIITAIVVNRADVQYTVPDYINVILIDEIKLNPKNNRKLNTYRRLFNAWKRLLKWRNRLFHININNWGHSKFELKSRYSMPVKLYLDEHKSATVISFLPLSISIVLLIAKCVKNKIIFSERSDPVSAQKNNPHRYSILKAKCNYADYGVFQTPMAASFYCNLADSKKRIILNPIRADVPETWQGERKKEFFSLGRYNEAKNYPMLINAFSKVHKLYPDYILKLYGHGPLENELKQLIVGLELSDSVFLKPFCEDVLEKVISSTAYISSSNYEGLSNAMIESMAMGLPVICTDCPAGGAGMLIESYKNGILVPVGDSEELSRAMIYVIEHPEESEQMGQAAVVVRNLCSNEIIFKEWMEIIENDN